MGIQIDVKIFLTFRALTVCLRKDTGLIQNK